MKYLNLIFLALIGFSATAQTQEPKEEEKANNYDFEIVKEISYTPIQNQNRSSTCWSFSTLSFLESEILRTKNIQVPLAEMYIVRHTYQHKADQYVRMHGNITFAPGGAFHDVVEMIDLYGIVPEVDYPGLLPSEKLPYHGEMDVMLKAMVDVVVKNPNRKVSKVWKTAYNSTLDAYLGVVPDEFEFEGKQYSPKSFADYLDINADDYIEISSFTHHPFYEKFMLEVPDNWMLKQVYNLPLDEFMQVMDYAINNDFSLGWGADVSEKGFSHKNGIGILPAIDWKDMDADVLKNVFDNPVEQMDVTQEYRQEGFDNYQTQDDHAMHIIGILKDKLDNKYYAVKNSWGVKNPHEGFMYVSESYVKAKTISYMVHKDALPKDIAKKLGL